MNNCKSTSGPLRVLRTKSQQSLSPFLSLAHGATAPVHNKKLQGKRISRGRPSDVPLSTHAGEGACVTATAISDVDDYSLETTTEGITSSQYLQPAPQCATHTPPPSGAAELAAAVAAVDAAAVHAAAVDDAVDAAAAAAAVDAAAAAGSVNITWTNHQQQHRQHMMVMTLLLLWGGAEHIVRVRHHCQPGGQAGRSGHTSLAEHLTGQGPRQSLFPALHGGHHLLRWA